MPWFHDWIIRLQGASVIKIVGGKNVKYTSSLFSECRTDLLDLSQFNTSNVTNMYGMFLECQAKYIDPKILQAYKERYVL